MENPTSDKKGPQRLTFGVLSLPARVLASCVILIMSFGMLGAAGQIVVHDIIPTFYEQNDTATLQGTAAGTAEMAKMAPEADTLPPRGDLFEELPLEPVGVEEKPFYKDERFVWTLRWTHIHLFGIGMIFIFMGAISLLLDAGAALRSWLIALPFVGMLIDIAAVWLKGFVSPAFFALHVLGGGLFGLVFAYVSLRALWEMWLKPRPREA